MTIQEMMENNTVESLLEQLNDKNNEELITFYISTPDYSKETKMQSTVENLKKGLNSSKAKSIVKNMRIEL